MDESKENLTGLQAPTTKTRDSQGSPVAILAIALASCTGYFSWKLWKRWQDEKKDTRDPHLAGPRQEIATKSSSKGSSFTFDRQPRSAASTSGCLAAAGSSSGSTVRRHSRQNPNSKSQKQLRKEAKKAKKAAGAQAVRDAEDTALAATIAKRAKDLGLGQQPPEPKKQYYVDYEGVTQGYDKIVEWQQTGKKKY